MINTTDTYVHAHTDSGTVVVAPGDEFPEGDYLQDLDPALTAEGGDDEPSAARPVPGFGQSDYYPVENPDAELEPVAIRGHTGVDWPAGPDSPITGAPIAGPLDLDVPLTKMNKAQLRGWLDQRHIGYDPEASRNALLALATERQVQEQEASDDGS